MATIKVGEVRQRDEPLKVRTDRQLAVHTLSSLAASLSPSASHCLLYSLRSQLSVAFHTCISFHQNMAT